MQETSQDSNIRLIDELLGLGFRALHSMQDLKLEVQGFVHLP